MFCYNCGKELPENALFCPFCGTQVGVSVESPFNANQNNQPVENESGNEPEAELSAEEVAVVNEPEYVEQSAEETVESTDDAVEVEKEREVAPHAISSFVWSLVANDLSIIPVLGFIFSLIAFIKSLKGRHIVQTDPGRYKLKGFLTASLIISIIALVFSVVGPILFASCFSELKDIFSDSGPFSSTFV